MNTVEELSLLFSLFHDGSIASAKGSEEHLTLRVDCQYLAELFQPDFYFFYVELVGVSEITFTTWEEPPVVTTGAAAALAIVLQADLEIAGARATQGRAFIDCPQYGPAASGSGGTLALSCGQVLLYDQQKRPLAVSALQQAARSYWDSLG